jgi:uncharacterized membrane protein (DUF106 family)
VVFGKFVELEKAETTETEQEQTQPTLPKPKEETKETTPKTIFYKTIKSLSWLWVTLLITIITGIIIYLLKKTQNPQ